MLTNLPNSHSYLLSTQQKSLVDYYFSTAVTRKGLNELFDKNLLQNQKIKEKNQEKKSIPFCSLGFQQIASNWNSIKMEQKIISPLQQQLSELLQCLLQLGKEFPQVLVQLAEIAQPDLPQEGAIKMLGKIFTELPPLLQDNAEQFQQWVVDPPSEFSTLKLLLDLREIQQLLSQISYLQLLQLTNNLVPPGLLLAQFEFNTFSHGLTKL